MLRSAAVYLPSYLFPRVATFFVILLGTRLLAPDEFGYFALVTVIGEFADAAMANWVRIALSRFGAREGGISYAFVQRMGGLAFICTLAAALTLGLCLFVIYLPAMRQSPLFAAMVILVSLTTLGFGVKNMIPAAVALSGYWVWRQMMERRQ